MARKKASKFTGLLTQMTYKDLQRACIVRGMGFDDCLNTDVIGLSNYFNRHHLEKGDLSLLDKFDEYVDKILEERGYDDKHPLRSHYLRLGYVGEADAEGKVSKKKPRGVGLPKREKKKRERDASLGNIYSGTKKALTFKMQREGKPLEETIAIVQKTFPEAVEKSIRIWYKKSQKMNNAKK